MLRYIARRLLYSVLVLIVISILTFLIFVKLPAGDRRGVPSAGGRIPSRSRTRGGPSGSTSR